MTRCSVISHHHNIETVRWFEREFAPMLDRLGFKREAAATILKLTEPEITRWRPHPAWGDLDIAKLRQVGVSGPTRNEILVNG